MLSISAIDLLGRGGRPSGARIEAMRASPNWRDGRFVNELECDEPGLVKPLIQWMRGADHIVPDGPLPMAELHGIDFDKGPESGLRITWLGHSTLLVEIDGYRVLIDPMWSERASPFMSLGARRFHPVPLKLGDLPPIDAVVITHDHFDHLDHRTVRALGERVPLYVAPLGVGAHLEHWGVPPERVVECDWWETVRLGDLRFTATPARHFSGRSLVMADKNATLWCGWALGGHQHRVYVSGDTGMFPGFQAIGQRLGPFDATIVEIGAYDPLWADLHIGPEQAVEARHALGSGLFIPVHWGTFALAMHPWTEPVERLLVAADQAGVPVAIPRPGERIEPADPAPVARWWPELPWRTGGEVPVVSSGLGGPVCGQPTYLNEHDGGAQ